MEKINKTKEEWKKELPADVYNVTREGGTEAPFTGKYWNEHGEGMYGCANCGQELFLSETKFDSGTGWPSFTDPVNLEHVELREDNELGPPSLGFGRASMRRTEVLCRRCGAHLGHVFDDLPRVAGKAGGPREKGGKRYCINSCALDLKKAGNNTT